MSHIEQPKPVDMSRLDIVTKCGGLDPIDSAQRKNGLLILYGEANAYWKNSEKLVTLLIANGADVNARGSHGVTPLFLASGNSPKNVVRVLLENGADVNAVSDYGTPLHCAASVNSDDNVSVLLDYGADINITYGNNIAPIDCAVLGSLVGADNYSHCPEECDIINEAVFDVLLRRILMMKSAHLYLNEANLDYLGPKAYYSLNNPAVEEDDDLHGIVLREFPSECEKEIAKMKREKIGSSDFTYYDILKASSRQLMNFSRNESLAEGLSSGIYEQRFKIYACMIRSKLKCGQRRRELLEKTVEFFHSIFVDLPDLCIDNIMSYLTYSDLFKLSDVGQRVDVDSSFFLQNNCELLMIC